MRGPFRGAFEYYRGDASEAQFVGQPQSYRPGADDKNPFHLR
jgi:hypothetical protein